MKGTINDPDVTLTYAVKPAWLAAPYNQKLTARSGAKYRIEVDAQSVRIYRSGHFMDWRILSNPSLFVLRGTVHRTGTDHYRLIGYTELRVYYGVIHFGAVGFCAMVLANLYTLDRVGFVAMLGFCILGVAGQRWLINRQRADFNRELLHDLHSF